MNQVPGVASGSRITTGGTSSPSVWVEINTRKRAREPTEDDREERDKKRRHGDGDDMETDDEITEPESRSSHRTTDTNSMASLERRGNWIHLTERRVHALYEAWWGKSIITRTIPAVPISDDIDNDVNEVSTPPPVGASPQPIVHTIVEIDQSIGTKEPIGEILLRQEFVTALEYTKSFASRRPQSGVIVTGQPGIGKTVYLWYLLRYRLSLRLPTVFAMGKTCYFFHETGAYVASAMAVDDFLPEDATTSSGSELVWALIDRMIEKTEPPTWLVTGDLFPVQSASPDMSRYKSWMKEKMAVLYTMNPWNWAELVAGLPLQQGVGTRNIDRSILQMAYDKYGPVPRNVYLAYFDKDGMTTYDRRTLHDIKNATYEQLERMVDEGDLQDPYSDTSNKLICLRRISPGVACAAVLSRFVAEKVLKAQAFANLHNKRKFVRLFTAIPQMGIARGWSFEAYVHNRFSSSSDIAGGITVYILAPISHTSEEYQPDLDSATTDLLFPLMDRSVRVYTSPNDFRDNPATTEYHIPSAKNNPGFDSFLITETAVYIFQMTVSHSHTADTGAQKGPRLLKQILPSDVPWHYVLVMPPTTNMSAATLTLVNEDWVDAVESFRLLVLD